MRSQPNRRYDWRDRSGTAQYGRHHQFTQPVHTGNARQNYTRRNIATSTHTRGQQILYDANYSPAAVRQIRAGYQDTINQLRARLNREQVANWHANRTIQRAQTTIGNLRDQAANAHADALLLPSRIIKFRVDNGGQRIMSNNDINNCINESVRMFNNQGNVQRWLAKCVRWTQSFTREQSTNQLPPEPRRNHPITNRSSIFLWIEFTATATVNPRWRQTTRSSRYSDRFFKDCATNFEMAGSYHFNGRVTCVDPF